MCFSATASFSAAAVLSGCGALGLYFATRHANRRFLAFNFISFFYAIQQFSEGMIWLNLSPMIFGKLFLFFAVFVYPWYTGLCCYFITRKKRLKTYILWITLFGFLFGAWVFHTVMAEPLFSVNQCRAHIFYDFRIMGKYPIDGYVMYLLLIPTYIFFTSLPCFISDRRYSSWLGGTIILSAIACLGFYSETFISVWCFYAAIISAAITLFTFIQWRKRRLEQLIV
ncbi:MAG: hypothetical protein A3E84_02145 [Gammaproteobacteria bacterium RIFCSPHIGHO2_12_FULL_42_13]|nr:MAG: hypothetical protein A3E84_02145 [Gammaproteobacteria bacterium RIFCSPHIGHO2_12_FULL_42_13]